MTVSAEFGNIQELETSLRALVLFKFSGGADADVYVGSPVMANALKGILRSIEDYWNSVGEEKRAAGWRDLYRVSNAKRHVELISAYAKRHPKWSSLTRDERLEWLGIIAAPYKLDEPGLALFDALLND